MPIEKNTLSLRQQFISEINQLINNHYSLVDSKKTPQELQSVVDIESLEIKESYHLPPEIQIIKKLLSSDMYVNSIAVELKERSTTLRHSSYFWFLPGIKDFKRDLCNILNHPNYHLDKLALHDLNDSEQREKYFENLALHQEEKIRNLQAENQNFKAMLQTEIDLKVKVEELQTDLDLRKDALKSLADENLLLLQKIKEYEIILDRLTPQLGVNVVAPSNSNNIPVPQKICKM